MELHDLSIHFLGIIRMEREDVEKAEVEDLMSGVQEIDMQSGATEKLDIKTRSKKTEVKSKSSRHTEGASSAASSSSGWRWLSRFKKDRLRKSRSQDVFEASGLAAAEDGSSE